MLVQPVCLNLYLWSLVKHMAMPQPFLNRQQVITWQRMQEPPKQATRPCHDCCYKKGLGTACPVHLTSRAAKTQVCTVCLLKLPTFIPMIKLMPSENMKYGREINIHHQQQGNSPTASPVHAVSPMEPHRPPNGPPNGPGSPACSLLPHCVLIYRITYSILLHIPAVSNSS